MDISFYHSALILPALGICIASCVILLKQHKTLGALLMLSGFVTVAATHFSINYCVGLAVLDAGMSDYPLLCNSVSPHINGIGFLLIAIGVFKFTQGAQNA